MLLLILYVAPQLNPLHLSTGAKYPKQNCAQFWIPFFVKFFTCREAARSCRSVGKKIKKGLMDFETLKPLFLVLFGIILSSFEPV